MSARGASAAGPGRQYLHHSSQCGAARRPIPSRRNAAGLPGGCLRSSLRAAQFPPAGMPPACPADSYARRYVPRQSPPAGMPPACPADAYARRYVPPNPLPPECRRLARRILTLVATRRPIRSRRNAAGLPGGFLRSSLRAAQSAPADAAGLPGDLRSSLRPPNPSRRMPPACPADSYARRYVPPNPLPPECRRLARRILTLVATRRPIRSRRNAAGLPGGFLRSSLRAAQSAPAGMPPACPADSYARRYVPPNPLPPECRRLARRILTLVATRRPIRSRRTNSGGTRRDAQPWRLPGSPGTRQLTLFRWLMAQGGKTRW